uniref:HTH psq-type domain-containing protein n=1 Tax=Homalodisca liturata TaxID=320908 RepID=A0A1B6IQG8_9HEMI
MNTENQTVKRRGRPRIHLKRLHYQNVGRGVPLRTQARKLVCTAKEYFQQEKTNNGPLLPVAKVVQRTAAALGINKNTVVKMCSEKKKNMDEGGSGEVHIPNKKKLPCQKRVTNLDNFQKDAIRRHVYAYYRRKEYPTLKNLIQSLKTADLFNGCKSSLSLFLKQLSLKYK